MEPAEPVRRYECDHPGDLIHLDITAFPVFVETVHRQGPENAKGVAGCWRSGINWKRFKRLGKFERAGHRITGDRMGQSNTRGIGWEYVHVCVGDASRLSFSAIHPSEKAVSAIAHLKAAMAWYASIGATGKRVMTHNGSCDKSHAFKAACSELGIRHIRTKPYMPKTNGKAERFIQTALREWAYARA